MQFSLASLFVLVAIAAVLCRACMTIIPYLPALGDTVWLLGLVVPFGAGALMAWVKGLV